MTRRLWEQVCKQLVDNWEDLDVWAQNQARERIVKRWRSIRDRFKKEFNKEMQAPSGSGGRSSRYKYAQALLFLRSTMVSRSTVGSTREPAAELNPSGAIPQESATAGHFDSPGPSAPSQPSLASDALVPSTSAGASWPPALHESAESSSGDSHPGLLWSLRFPLQVVLPLLTEPSCPCYRWDQHFWTSWSSGDSLHQQAQVFYCVARLSVRVVLWSWFRGIQGT
ncbi:uncharacterized protein [Ranitomeya imitator]|uniref:uncharacterized protein isoform X2 n=1 Tax=Ranitomeya imitator TaxID=111125 RepID=UPI0037E9BC91